VAVLRFLPPDLVAEDLVAKTNSPSLLQVGHQRDILSGSHVFTYSPLGFSTRVLVKTDHNRLRIFEWGDFTRWVYIWLLDKNVCGLKSRIKVDVSGKARNTATNTGG